MLIAKKIDSGLFIGIDNVRKGASCNCVCASCGALVVAKKGEKNQWHFAHKIESHKECDYSFWVSLRLFSREIIQTLEYFAVEKNKSLFGVVKIKQKKFNIEFNEYIFDVLLETFMGNICVNFLTEENNRKRHYKTSAKEYFNQILFLEIDLRKTILQKKYITKYIKEIIFSNEHQLKKWFGAKEYYNNYYKSKPLPESINILHSQKHYSRKTKTSYGTSSNKTNTQNLSCKISINEQDIDKNRKYVDINFNAKIELLKMGFNNNRTNIQICNDMIPFFNFFHRKKIVFDEPYGLVGNYGVTHRCMHYKNIFYYCALIEDKFIFYDVFHNKSIDILFIVDEEGSEVDVLPHIENYHKEWRDIY